MPANYVPLNLHDLVKLDDQQRDNALEAYFKRITAELFPPETDIELWMLNNAPTSKQQLANIRYALYHRCSRAEFKVARIDKKAFRITGPHSTVLVSSNTSRQILLIRLRELARDGRFNSKA